ncbi:hypothetical protein NDU88_003362, partial [Pleurodeles waltl]
ERIFVEVFSPFWCFFPLALLLRDTACSWHTHCLQHRGYQKELRLLGPRPNIQEQDPRHSLCGLQGKAALQSFCFLCCGLLQLWQWLSCSRRSCMF